MGRRGHCSRLRVFWSLLCLVGSRGSATLLCDVKFWNIEGCIGPFFFTLSFIFSSPVHGWHLLNALLIKLILLNKKRKKQKKTKLLLWLLCFCTCYIALHSPKSFVPSVIYYYDLFPDLWLFMQSKREYERQNGRWRSLATADFPSTFLITSSYALATQWVN